MRKLLLILLPFMLAFSASAQPFGNEWIDYDQQHLRIEVTTTGIHRLDSTNLAAALAGINVNLSSLDPRDFRMFGRGKEIAIRIPGEGDGVFNQGDYIEFFAERNDGWLDTAIYTNPDYQSNPYYSLYQDTAAYFLSITTSGSTTPLRMSEETDVNFSAYNSAPYFWTTNYVEAHTHFFPGFKTLDVSASEVTDGEGWWWTFWPAGGTKNWNIPTPNVYLGGPDATAVTTSASLNDPIPATGMSANHHFQVSYFSNNMAAANVVYDQQYSGYHFERHVFPIGNSELGSSTTRISHTALQIAQGTSYHTMGHIAITYPHTFNMDAQGTYEMQIPAGSSKQTIEMTNFSGTQPLLYDVQVGKYIPVLLDNGAYKAVVPNNGNSQVRCFVTDETQVTNLVATAVSPVNGTGTFTNFLNVTADSAYIIITHDRLWASATDYAAYRQATGYETVMANVNELYDQFGYGVRKHPLSIRQFLGFALFNFPSKPSHVFLIGKAIRFANPLGAAQGSRTNAANYENNLVPTFGYPGSDMLFTYDLIGDQRPAIPIGRLAALSNQQVNEYRQKMEQYEAAQTTPQEWMKRVLHFGGGSDTDEQDRFKAYLSAYQGIAEDTCYAADVYEFYKTTSAPIQISISDSVTDLINNGVSLMTFFGHASGDGFDVALDEPGNYQNSGKYPLLIGNSCYTGGIHEPGTSSTSEDFVLIPDKGMIGFLASVNVGLDLYLHFYTESLYKHISYKSYGRTLGQCMKAAVDDYFDLYGTANMLSRSTAHTMSLHGDPALRVNVFPDPDFVVEPTSVYFEPGLVTADVDSFSLNVVIKNIGKGTYEPFDLTVDHYFPNGIDSTYTIQVPGIRFIDTITIRLPVDPLNNLGLNTFDVRVDIPSFVIESEDLINNEVLSTSLLVVNSGIIPVYPYDFAIVPDSVMPLSASTGDPYAPVRSYVFEVDTTDLFNSPFKISEIVTAPGGVVEWQPKTGANTPLEMADSTVYFWRVSADTVWRESSFQYIRGKSGWGQAHHFQYKDDEYNVVQFNRNPREFTFQPDQVDLTAQVVGNPNSNSYTETEFRLDLDLQMSGGCGLAPAIHVVVIDSIDLECWGTYGHAIGDPNTMVNQHRQYGNINNGNTCLKRTEQYFNFRQNISAEMLALEAMLDTVPEGNYLMAYTWIYSTFDTWDVHNPGLYQKFQDLGSTEIYQGAQDSVPWIFFVKKGDPSTAVEMFGTHINDTIAISELMISKEDRGTIAAPAAGPAYSWNALYWDEFALETNSADSIVIQLYGIASNGQDTLLGAWPSSQDSVPNLNQVVDAATYPYVRLEAYMKDDSTQTPGQMDRWQLLYDPVPEAALNASAGSFLYGDTLSEGEDVQFAIAIENISQVDMDSMLVSYWIEDADRNRTEVPYDRQAPLLVDGVLYDTISINTEGFGGTNYFWVEANPINPATGVYDQLEQHHFNNIAVRTFQVSTDRINPLLDVTFDGIHIMDGELVSAQPFIYITLDDENPFLLLDEPSDTSYLEVYIKNPGGALAPVYFRNGAGEEQMIFNPAVDAENRASIEYNPELLEDGVYELVVYAIDKSGNVSGAIDYSVTFEVVNRLTISEVMNYPNPFTTRTHFVFTLTGDEPPPHFMIRIMTVTGRVVREITEAELGPLRIGRNMTEFAWDGTDEFGDRLANGVYLYQVIVKDDQMQDVEQRSAGVGQYFTKGFGKMYLMR